MTQADADHGHELNRRGFIRRSAAAASASLLATALGAAAEPQADQAKPAEIKRKIKLGIVGCGNRGPWISKLFQQHGGYEVYAMADYFQDAVEQAAAAVGVDKARRFTGLSGYKRVIDSGVEALAIMDLPYFYPQQAKAAVDAGCHVYMAKPIAVDVPGCLAIQSAAKLATEKKRCFLVDYQIPTEPANIEVANRIREGALGRLAHILSYGFAGAWPDPPKGATIENRLRGGVWLSDVALGGDFIAYDIHIIDGVTWVMRKRPVRACGSSRRCRLEPHGDRTDSAAMVFEYDDGLLWTHVTQALDNNADVSGLSASFFGLAATAHIQYGGKVYVRGGAKHYVGTIGSIYDEGAKRNIADFYRCVMEGRLEHPTVKRAVDGTLTAILGREASAGHRTLTMEELIKDNKKLELDLRGLKA